MFWKDKKQEILQNLKLDIVCQFDRISKRTTYNCCIVHLQLIGATSWFPAHHETNQEHTQKCSEVTWKTYKNLPFIENLNAGMMLTSNFILPSFSMIWNQNPHPKQASSIHIFLCKTCNKVFVTYLPSHKTICCIFKPTICIHLHHKTRKNRLSFVLSTRGKCYHSSHLWTPNHLPVSL